MLGKAIAIVVAALAAPACHRSDAAESPGGTVVGQASVPEGLAGRLTGTVSVVVRGTGDISDPCADATTRQFVATYTGPLVIEDDGMFHGDLFPGAGPVTTPGGCVVKDLRVERVDDISVRAAVPGFVGAGAPTFQNLASIDNSQLQAGRLDELHVSLELQPER